jgi:hypothetical protein
VSVLVQDHGNDLSARVAFEVEIRVDSREKESVSRTARQLYPHQ